MYQLLARTVEYGSTTANRRAWRGFYLAVGAANVVRERLHSFAEWHTLIQYENKGVVFVPYFPEDTVPCTRSVPIIWFRPVHGFQYFGQLKTDRFADDVQIQRTLELGRRS